MLKKIMIGATLTASLAAPALAQSYQPSVGSGNIVGPANSPNSGPTMPGYAGDHLVGAPHTGYGAYAYAPPTNHRHVAPKRRSSAR